MFREHTQIPNFMKIRPVRTELFHAEGQTDMIRLIAAFSIFANAPKKRNMSEFGDVGVKYRVSFKSVFLIGYLVCLTLFVTLLSVLIL